MEEDTENPYKRVRSYKKCNNMKSKDQINEILNDKELEEIKGGINANDQVEAPGLEGVSNCCNGKSQASKDIAAL